MGRIDRDNHSDVAGIGTGNGSAYLIDVVFIGPVHSINLPRKTNQLRPHSNGSHNQTEIKYKAWWQKYKTKL